MGENRWKPEDIFAFKCPGEMEISPDGKKLAFVVKTLDQEKNENRSNIYLKEKKEIRQITFSNKDQKPRFSPDGTKLAFISNRFEKPEIWLLPLEGGEPYPIKMEEKVQDYFWHPGGGEIFFTSSVFCKTDDWLPYPGAPEKDGQRLKDLAEDKKDEDKKDKEEKTRVKAKVINKFNYRRDGIGYLGHKSQHVFRVEIPQKPEEKAEPKQITKGDYDYAHPDLATDGRFLVFVANFEDREGLDPKKDLYIWDLESGREAKIYSGPGPAFSPRWSPCGEYIAFAGHDMSFGMSTTSHLWLLPVREIIEEIKSGKEVQPLTREKAQNILQEIDRPVGGYAGSEPGCGGGDFIRWEGDELYFLLTKDGVPGIFKSDKKGQVEEVKYNREFVVSGFTINKNQIIYIGSSPEKPGEIYQGGEAFTSLNSELMQKKNTARFEEINYKSKNDGDIQGWLYYPKNWEKGRKYPLLLLIHGGPHGAYGPAFMFKAQLFSDLGYFVLLTNPRGSESYGQEFACCIDGNWGDLDYADVMAGVDTVVNDHKIDEDNIFAHGWSYGGYLSCWLPTQTERFKAICAGASVSNMLSGYGTSDITLADEWEYGGRPWKDPLHLMEHSPLGKAENVNTPMLLLHGENDMRCPPGQSEEYFIALKRLGKEVAMVRYPGEFHGLKEPKNRLDLYERLLAWFEYYRNKN